MATDEERQEEYRRETILEKERVLVGTILGGTQCGKCGRYDTQVVTSFWKETRIDPESASGYCRACNHE